MAEQLKGPVTVVEDGVERSTVVAASSIRVGRPATRGGVRPRPAPLPDGMIAGRADVGIPATAMPEVSVDVGGRSNPGGVTVRDDADRPTITLDGRNGLVTLGTGRGAAGSLVLRSDRNGPVILATGRDGRISFRDAGLKETLVIDGVRGDIELVGADCAEDFEVAEPSPPGAVLTVDDDGRLHPCRHDYDRRVVGVVSGAGGLRPALRLGRGARGGIRQPLALVGKVLCLVTADQAPVGVGDLLTTSDVDGHAMKATDATRAFGAVLGKSLGSLSRGRGLVPVIVALQ